MYRLSKDIIDTVTYYDVFDYPLSAFEIWKHLLTLQEEGVRPSSYLEVYAALRNETMCGTLLEERGFYGLRGREGLASLRIRKEKISAAKLRRIKQLARLIRLFPYVRFAGATGSLSLKHGDIGSDWDLFVVLRAGKIWTGRVIMTGILLLMGKWRHGRKVRNRACLNYFVTDESLEIGTQDLFSAHEYRFMIPLFNYPLFQKFELKNRWIARFKPNFSLSEIRPIWCVGESHRSFMIRRTCESIADAFPLERLCARWQKSKISRNPKTRWEGSYIEATDRALIFLPRPRGPRVYEEFKRRLSV